MINSGTPDPSRVGAKSPPGICWAIAVTFGAAVVPWSAATAESRNPARDYVQQRKAAMLEQVLGKEAAARMRVAPQIIGGTVAPATRWRSTVGLLFAMQGNNYDAHFCGGTLVDRRFILTAAHCVDFLAADDIKVLAGTASLVTGGTRFDVEKIIVHPRWDSKLFDFDIALVKVTEPIKGVRLSRLIKREEEDVLVPRYTPSFAAGWGNTGPSPPKYPKELHQVKVETQTRALCNRPQSYNGSVTARMVCAGFPEGGKDTCDGDSGGPLTARDEDGAWRVQFGIVSWGIGCAAPNYFGVYTRLAVLSAWVEKMIAKH